MAPLDVIPSEVLEAKKLAAALGAPDLRAAIAWNEGPCSFRVNIRSVRSVRRKL